MRGWGSISLVEKMSKMDALEEYGTLIRGNHKLMKSYKDEKQYHSVNTGSSLG